MNAWQERASDVYGFINFTKDMAKQHSDRFVPVLDVKVRRREEGGAYCTYIFREINGV